MLDNTKPTIAFLLVVHNNPEQVNMFINLLLTYENSYIYVHVDAKNPNMVSQIIKSERVTILPEHYDVQWGDYTQITVNNYLLNYAVTTQHHDFYSLHSGADMAIRPLHEFVSHLNETNCYAYYDAQKLPTTWQYRGGFGRIALNWPKMFRKRAGKHSPRRYLRSLYGRLYGAGIIKGKKLPPEYTFYGGHDWFTISEDCVNDLLAFVDSHPDFESLFIKSLSGAEIYYPTLFEALKSNKKVCNNSNLRYVDWKDRGQDLPPGSPNTCSMSFLDDIIASKKFFARKFSLAYDRKIIEYFLDTCGYKE
ncbi:MAG: hypothetical protein IJ298_01515 [Ruminococcus sp.]|nr:hypothetical protein [Ruminococcus sp.]